MDKQKECSQAIRPTLEKLRQCVDDLSLTPEILGLLLPNGIPHEFESDLWDYKEKLPSLPQAPTDADRKLHKAELGDIIKDAVAFYNAFGGYIVFGVTDKGKNRVPGTDTQLDCGDFNKRIFGYTDTNIQCLYKIFNLPDAISAKTIGILLIPRRSPGMSPVKFKKDGPEKPSGGRSFAKETYVRVRDECRPFLLLNGSFG
jgi:predicted HTH transcriptional regulator